MKNAFRLLLILLFVSSAVISQTNQSNGSEGDIYQIGKVINDHYNHIQFPKSNIIRKRGGIPDYKSIMGKKVIVTNLKEQKDGTVIATIKLISGKKFFRSHKYLKVQLDGAIEAQELVKV